MRPRAPGDQARPSRGCHIERSSGIFAVWGTAGFGRGDSGFHCPSQRRPASTVTAPNVARYSLLCGIHLYSFYHIYVSELLGAITSARVNFSSSIYNYI